MIDIIINLLSMVGALGEVKASSPAVSISYSIAETYIPIDIDLRPDIPIVALAGSDNLDITAESYLVYDIESGKQIWGKKTNTRRSMASITKLMTTVVALEQYQLNDIVNIPERVKTIYGTRANLQAGDRLSVKQLIYMMLLPSANDAAISISMNFSDGNAGFVRKMNEKAQELGMTQTNWTNAIGYDNPQHYTTARDLLILAKYALENPTIAYIAKLRNITIVSKKYKVKHYLKNTNKLFDDTNIDIWGLKTGTTGAAGQCLIVGVNISGRPMLIILLDSEDRYADAYKIINRLKQKIPNISI